MAISEVLQPSMMRGILVYVSMISVVLLLLEMPSTTIASKIPKGINNSMNFNIPPSLFAIRNTKSVYKTNREEALLSKSNLLVRGGDITTDDEDYDTSSDDEEESTGTGGGVKESKVIEEEKEEEIIEATNKTISNIPIKVNIRTNLNIALIDQTLELMASPKRNIASIKLSISRQMISRPPMSLQRILLGTRELNNEDILHDLVTRHDDEDDDSDDEDDEDKEEEQVLNFILDTPVPPIDPKFAIQEQHFFEKLHTMSTDHILDIYIANIISMFHLKQQMLFSSTSDEQQQDATNHTSSLPNNIQMKKDIIQLKQQFVSTILSDDVKLSLLQGRGVDEDEDKQEEEDDETQDDSKRRRRPTTRIKGGAKMTVKRVIQKNLNINWPDTIRNSLLFLFFGYFGTPDPFIKKLMIYYGAPLCFLLQLRFVKIFAKQLFYMCFNSPSFIISLLPAPTQLILGTNVWDSMKILYPEYYNRNRNFVVNEEEESSEGMEQVDGEEEDNLDFDDEYDDDY